MNDAEGENSREGHQVTGDLPSPHLHVSYRILFTDFYSLHRVGLVDMA